MNNPLEIIIPMSVKFTVRNRREQSALLDLIARSDETPVCAVIPTRIRKRAKSVLSPEFKIQLSSL